MCTHAPCYALNSALMYLCTHLGMQAPRSYLEIEAPTSILGIQTARSHLEVN